jgi:hypothetical protein
VLKQVRAGDVVKYIYLSSQLLREA